MAAQLSFDLSGLELLERELAQLVAQQASSPSSFVGGQSFNTTFNAAKTGILPGGIAALPGPGSLTTAGLVQRLSALLQLAQTLPV